MSAADPAEPAPPVTLGKRDAAVIDITARSSRTATRGRRRPVTDPQPEPGPAGIQQQLAEHFEMTFNHHRLTLTDEMTAAAYGVTLQIVRGILEGTQAQGIITETQRLELDEVIEGMTGAPRLV